MLELKNVSKIYGDLHALDNVSLKVENGEWLAIMGRSSSGKSTFLNLLAGLLEPTTGKVYLDDTDLYAMEDRERSKLRNCSIGVIPQGQTGLYSLTVLENVKLPSMMYSREPCSDEFALSLLERVGIAHLRDTYPNELSGGEMRRLAIARAQVMQPRILLADEPTGDLDDENTEAVLRLLRQSADEGTAVLLVAHEREAAAYADMIYKMNNGVLTLNEE